MGSSPGIVSLALSLIAWGIVNERRDRVSYEQGREVFGEAGASMECLLGARSTSG